MGKLVSVVVQAYNSADTICETLNSIKRQDYQPIELIISDDASRDNTVDVARQWLQENQSCFHSVQMLTTPVNTGIPGNNNRALKKVQGEYVEFLAADDCMEPDAISQYVLFCENNPNVIPISKVILLSDQECDMTSVQQYCNKCCQFATLSREEQYRLILIQNRITAPAASFYPMKLLTDVGNFDERYRLMEDYPMNVKILRKGYSFGFLDKALIRYRISEHSVTGSPSPLLKKTERDFFFRQRFWYLFQNGMGWEAIKQSKSWIKK